MAYLITYATIWMGSYGFNKDKRQLSLLFVLQNGYKGWTIRTL